MRNAKRFAVKVQLPIGGDAEPMALVYNHDRSFFAQMPVAHIAEWMGDDLKAYFRAHYDKATARLFFHKRIPDQPW